MVRAGGEQPGRKAAIPSPTIVRGRGTEAASVFVRRGANHRQGAVSQRAGRPSGQPAAAAQAVATRRGVRLVGSSQDSTSSRISPASTSFACGLATAATR